ncbi:hypothetical protein G6F37_001649 [Rhizopus arrhizus]|nr:hypothetical protein G6F38_001894 [Rhizopus arrhizus]KAG1162979.1 hypothetical protein G6F37_001649 [Rhizopus arrhizus]
MSRITYYDLELEDLGKVYWSRNTCKTRFALNLKNIPYDTEWLTFNEVAKVIPSKTKTGARPTVPIIEDKETQKVIQDSWEIVNYLEEAFPDSPSAFHGNQGIHKFFQSQCEKNIAFPIFKMVVLTVGNACGPFKQSFRETREGYFNMSLEKLAGQPEDHAPDLKKGLEPIHEVLKSYPFVTGNQAGWADVVLAAHLNFLEKLKPELFQAYVLDVFDDDILLNWWKRVEYIHQINEFLTQVLEKEKSTSSTPISEANEQNSFEEEDGEEDGEEALEIESRPEALENQNC